MYYRKEDARAFTIPGGTQGVLYPPHPKGEQSVAVVTMDGVYPEKGFSLNDRCTETLCMTDGEFRLTCDGVAYTLRSGDLFSVLPGNRYRIEGKGTAVICISPSWDSAQNHIVD